MTVDEQIRQIVYSKELSDSEKLDRLHSPIPLEVFEIEDLSKATPEQRRQLKDSFAVTGAMQQVRCGIAAKE
jgi:hypothetical protein